MAKKKKLKAELIPLIKSINESEYQPDTTFLSGNFPIEKHLFLPKKENPFWKQIYTEYYNIMKSKNINNKDFLDASSVFLNPEECPFIDSHHYSPYGNQKIAKLIANKLNV